MIVIWRQKMWKLLRPEKPVDRVKSERACVQGRNPHQSSGNIHTRHQQQVHQQLTLMRKDVPGCPGTVQSDTGCCCMFGLRVHDCALHDRACTTALV
eukprot:352673-Chlamydomonas_euryale.AAC.5